MTSGLHLLFSSEGYPGLLYRMAYSPWTAMVDVPMSARLMTLSGTRRANQFPFLWMTFGFVGPKSAKIGRAKNPIS
jgi:hypothetical protein